MHSVSSIFFSATCPPKVLRILWKGSTSHRATFGITTTFWLTTAVHHLMRCMRFVDNRRDLSRIIESARKEGRLFLRAIHGDPKTDNVMMDLSTRQAVSIVDLDTVKPGLVHYDIGDCLRSACNRTGEDTEQWETIRFDADIARAVLKGYCSVTGKFLTDNDFDYIYDSIRLIAFELGLRFLTDYLEGDVYFRVRRPDHNLVRALVQFRLTESIESQEATIRSIIRDVR
jgi:Ser/Thr protein kinase RdoA (MazF antagonist)